MTGTRQSELAAAVRVSQQVVSRWVTGKTVPEPGTVFLIEDRLGMPAGDLSRHLGYVRVDRRSEERVPRTVEAIHADPELNDLGKSILLGVYETVRRARRQAGEA